VPPLGRERGFKLDLHLRCHRCARMAYGDEYEGELGDDGYLCRGCVRLVNEELVRCLTPSAK